MAHPVDVALEFGYSVAISGAGATVTLASAVAGKRLLVTYLYLETAGSTDLTFNSITTAPATTALSGAIQVNSSSLEMRNSGYPVLVANAIGDKIEIGNSGSIAIEGTAIIMETDNG
jgi:hypothetical protein